MVDSTITCEHCGNAAQRPIFASVGGRELYFCCAGCLEVYRILTESNDPYQKMTRQGDS